MSFEKLKNVLNKISQDTNLLKKFREKVSVETVNLLKQNGYNETEEQMQQDVLKLLNINEEELELVSGGVNLEMNKFKKISAIALAGLSMSPNFAQSFGADPQKLVSKEQPKNQVVTQKIDTKTENKPNTATDNKNKAPLKPAAPSVSKTNTNKSSSGAPIDFAQIGGFLGVGLLSGFGLTQMFNTFYLNRKQIDEAVAETKKKLEEEQKKVTSLNQEIEKLKNQSSGSSKRNDEKIKELQKQLEESKKKVEELTKSLGNGNEAQNQLLQKQNELEQKDREIQNLTNARDDFQNQVVQLQNTNINLQNQISQGSVNLYDQIQDIIQHQHTKKDILRTIFDHYKKLVPNFYHDLINVMADRIFTIYNISDKLNLDFKSWDATWYQPICDELNKSKYGKRLSLTNKMFSLKYFANSFADTYLNFKHWNGKDEKWNNNNYIDVSIYILGSVMRLVATGGVVNAPENFDWSQTVMILYRLLVMYNGTIYQAPSEIQQ